MLVLLTTPAAVVLSVWMGVIGCFHPISDNVRRMGTSSFAVTYRAPISASAADDIKQNDDFCDGEDGTVPFWFWVVF